MEFTERISRLRQLLNMSANCDNSNKEIIISKEIFSLIPKIEDDIFIKLDPEVFGICRLGVLTSSRVKSASMARRLLLDAISKDYIGIHSNGSILDIWHSALKENEISADSLLSAVSILFEAHDVSRKLHRAAFDRS